MKQLFGLKLLFILIMLKDYIDCDTVENDIFEIDYEACGKTVRLDKKTNFIVKDPSTRNPPGSFPWMVSMGEQRHYNASSTTWIHRCGGSLVTLRHVITAAHCATDLSKKIDRGAIFIRAGDGHLQDTNDDDDVQVNKVVAYNIHPDYRYPARYYDVAVLTLEIPMNLTSTVRTICLPPRSTLRQKEDNIPLTVSGWGTGLQSEAGHKLHDTKVQIFSEAVCNRTHAGQRLSMHAVPHGFSSHVFCGGDQSGNEGTCQGDSGSPAVFFQAEDNHYIIIGVVSGGLLCGTQEYPNIYIRISDLSIFSWIYHQIGHLIPINDEKNNYNLEVVEGVYEQIDKKCPMGEACKQRKYCPYVEDKYQEITRLKQHGTTAADQEKNRNIRDFLKSIICNRNERAFCCPKPASGLIIPLDLDKGIEEIHQNCSVDERCETKNTCPYIQQQLSKTRKATSTEKNDIINLLTSKICNKSEKAFCCPMPEPVSCVLSNWSQFEKCSASCRGGKRSRYRKVLQENSNAFSSCEDLVALDETESCKVLPCPGDPDYCSPLHCNLPPSLGYAGIEKPLEECKMLDTFNSLPIPVSKSRKRGVHPVVCCPNEILSPPSSFTVQNCSCLSQPVFHPNETSTDEFSVHKFCCILETDSIQEYEEYEEWCAIEKSVHKISEENCSSYFLSLGNSTKCVNINDCSGIFESPSNPQSNIISTDVCGWDDEEKSLKICCPGELVKERSQPPLIKSRYPGYPCTDRTTHCKKWKINDGCRTDIDFAIDQQNIVSSGDMFDFMMGSCMESCGRCGTKGCRDEHATCQDWARRGFCITNPKWMVHTCRESCGVCGFLSKQETTDQFIGEKSYSDFKSLNFDCGRYNKEIDSIPVPAVVGGVGVGSSKICGSTLISDRWAVTAAHCFGGFSDGNLPMKTTKIRDNTLNQESIEFLNVYKHPHYKYPSLYNDIALLELGRRVEFNWTRYGDSPMCLDRTGQNAVNIATFQGYGFTVNGTRGDFKELNLSIINNSECKVTLAYNSTNKPSIRRKIKRDLPNGLSDQIFCTQGEYVEDAGAILEPCKGDSGGPIFVDGGQGRKKLAGIISGGIGCGQGFPGWNTKVSQFIPWIECIVDHHKFKQNYGQNWTKEYIDKQCSSINYNEQ